MRQVGLIRVLTTEDEQLRDLHGNLVHNDFPEFRVVSACIPGQPEGIHDEESELRAVPKVLALGRQLQQKGMEAVIVSCAGDPAVPELCRALKVPVIGAGRAVAAAARTLNVPIGVLGLTKKVPGAIREILGEYMVADVVPENVRSTLNLMTSAGREATLAAACNLKEKGAKAILLACTGMSTIGVAPKLAAALAMPVFDPVRAEAAMLWNIMGGACPE